MGSEIRRMTSWAGNTLAWLVILGIAAVLTVAVLVPRVSGATPYTVLTGSMAPAMPAGSLVVTRPAVADEIGVGAVVTYQLKSGEAAMVTHRVVATSYDGTGRLRLQTQGDANEAPDAQWVRPEQIRGVLWYSVPHLGHVNNLITGSQERLAVTAAVALLLGYAAVMFAGGLRDRSRRRKLERSTSAALSAPSVSTAPRPGKELADV